MPDLITRLSALHAVLTSRLALQESLLNLSGRLDMALSQMETRSSNAPTAPTTALKAKQPAVPYVIKRYIEGESEEEDDVEVEMDDDGGSLEDIELGGFDDMEEDEEEEEEEDSDEGGHGLNGFIDDEAEEDYSEDEDEEDLSE
jgi:U3 small nucleolar RNA-associated protein 5